MAHQVMSTESARTAPPERRERLGSIGDLRILAAVLAVSWILPFAANALGVDWVLIPVLLAVIACSIRAGGGLLDRLVIAGFLTCGAVMTFGLVASLWPWGLDPAPFSAVLLSVIGGAAWWGGRKPELPWRSFRGSDAIILATGALVWHYIHAPVAGKPVDDRFGSIMTIEDRLTHFDIFDTIHRVGGYLFLHQAASASSVQAPTQSVYPQGSHFLLTWVDTLMRSTTALGPTPDAMSRYFTYVLVAYTLLCMGVVWAARWVGGPRLRGWRAALVCTAVSAAMLVSPLAMLVPYAFDSESIGLLLLAVSIALLVRPAMGLVEYALVGCTALITVAYCYNVYAVFVVIVLLAGLLVYRERFRDHRIALYVSLAVGLAIAVIPSAIMVLSDFNVGAQAAEGGAIIPVPRGQMIGVGVLVLVAALGARNLKVGPVRVLVLTILGMVGVLAVFGAWQLHAVHHLSYYFEKLAIAGFIMCLIGIGTAGYLLRPMAGSRRKAGIRRRVAEPLLAIGISLSVLSILGGIQWGFPSTNNKLPSAWSQTDLAQWSRGELNSKVGGAARAFVTRDMYRVHGPALTLYSNLGYYNWQLTFFAQTMLHKAGMVPLLDDMLKVRMGASWPQGWEYRDSIAELVLVVKACPTPPTVLVGDEALADRIRDDLRKDRAEATVLFAPVGH